MQCKYEMVNPVIALVHSSWCGDEEIGMGEQRITHPKIHINFDFT